MKSALMRLREKLNLPSVSGSRGMTLIEIIIVVALLAGLMVFLVRNVTGQAEGAKRDTAKIGMNNIAQALQLYKIHNNKYPTSDQGLGALVTDPGNSKGWRGPYMETKELKDPWGNDFVYESDGNTYKVTSTANGGQEISIPESAASDAKEEPAK